MTKKELGLPFQADAASSSVVYGCTGCTTAAPFFLFFLPFLPPVEAPSSSPNSGNYSAVITFLPIGTNSPAVRLNVEASTLKPELLAAGSC
jgi:hypothetical protein